MWRKCHLIDTVKVCPEVYFFIQIELISSFQPNCHFYQKIRNSNQRKCIVNDNNNLHSILSTVKNTSYLGELSSQENHLPRVST